MRALHNEKEVDCIPELPQSDLQQVQLRAEDEGVYQVAPAPPRCGRAQSPAMSGTSCLVVRGQALGVKVWKKHLVIFKSVPERSGRIAKGILDDMSIPVDEEE